jgi:hypothetical protein
MNRAWAFIISKPLSDLQLSQVMEAGKRFVSSWTAHENKLAGSFEILYKRIIVVTVNEDVNGASGCSIDKLTRFIKETETAFAIELLNRLLVAYKNGNDVEVMHTSKIKALLADNTITENTIVLNTALANENELRDWEQPLKNTWLSKYLQKA